MRFTDQWQKEIAELGYPPLRIEPVKGRFTWSGSQKIKVYQVDQNGKRGNELSVSQNDGKQVIELDTAQAGPHWEVVITR
jgi:hypothetical protein